MTITCYGVPGSIDALHWAQLDEARGKAGGTHAVISGMSATVAGNSLSVAAGSVYVPGVLALSDASASLAVTPNGSSTLNRVDRLVLEVDWAGSMSTAGTLKILQGTPAAVGSAVEPAVTQTAGVLWQEPLYRFRVAAGDAVATNLTGERRAPQVRAVDYGNQSYACSGGAVQIPHNLGVAPLFFDAFSTNTNVKITPVNLRADYVACLLRRHSDNSIVGDASYTIIWKAEA